MKSLKLSIVPTLMLACFCIADAALAAAPAIHVGDDFRAKSLGCCLGDARFAMETNKAGRLSSSQSGNVVFGVGQDVAVVVICEAVNGGVRIPVVAASMDSATAAMYRNEVRVVAYDAVHFDTCP